MCTLLSMVHECQRMGRKEDRDMKRTSIREDSQLLGVRVMVIATLYFARVVFSPLACWHRPTGRGRSKGSMSLSFQETLIDVWRQVLVENAKAVELGSERYPV